MQLIHSVDTVVIGSAVLVFVAFLVGATVRIVKQFEKAVIFRLGRLAGTFGPGPVFIFPFVDKAVKVDMRVNSIDVPRQECITKDNVSVVVDAVIYYKVADAEKVLIEVRDFMEATFMIAQTTLRSVIGQIELDELLSQRDKVNKNLQGILDHYTTPWGVKVIMVEVKELALPEEMKRAMARQAEMERERRAKVINAEGEYQASEKLKQAAAVMHDEPVAMQLRCLQTLSEISMNKGSTIFFFPFPMDLVSQILHLNKDKSVERK